MNIDLPYLYKTLISQHTLHFIPDRKSFLSFLQDTQPIEHARFIPVHFYMPIGLFLI